MTSRPLRGERCWNVVTLYDVNNSEIKGDCSQFSLFLPSSSIKKKRSNLKKKQQTNNANDAKNMLFQPQQTTVLRKSNVSEFQQKSWILGVWRNLAWNNISTNFPGIIFSWCLRTMYLLASHAGFKSLMVMHFHTSVKCRYMILTD